MSGKDFVVVTNNPLVYDKFKETEEVYFYEVTYEELLKKVRDMVHEGKMLLSHPLSGSVKPGETPYKSVIVSKKITSLDQRSLDIIENALYSYRKFEDKTADLSQRVLDDFRLVDCTLIESGLLSANR